MRTAVELLHALIGLIVTWIAAGLAAWSYPPGQADIWMVSYALIVLLVGLAVRPVLAAYRQDRAANQ